VRGFGLVGVWVGVGECDPFVLFVLSLCLSRAGGRGRICFSHFFRKRPNSRAASKYVAVAVRVVDQQS